jgi:hypothetical protein
VVGGGLISSALTDTKDFTHPGVIAEAPASFAAPATGIRRGFFYRYALYSIQLTRNELKALFSKIAE